MTTSKYMSDLQSYFDSVAYGDVTVTVKRVNNHTVQVTTIATETLKYEDTEIALKDFVMMCKALSDANFSGNSEVKFTWKEGKIKLVGIKNEKITGY